VELAGPASVNLGEGLAGLEATITNTSGHKLPSGYAEGRVMWIEIDARYGDDVVWSSGAFEAGVGPTDDGQLRTYEGIAEQLSSGTTLHLLLNDHWVEDTRIPPLGLREDLQTDPVGDRYTLQGDGTWPHFDDHNYAFTGLALEDLTPGVADQLELSVRLLYLINTPEYLQLLVDDNQTNAAGTDVQAAFAAVGGPEPIVVAEQSVSVPLTGLIGGGDGDGDPGDGDGDPSGETSSDTGSGTGTEGPAIDGGGDSGCSCTGAAPSRSLGWLLLLPLLGIRRRRSR
jgi:hypothetical protein